MATLSDVARHSGVSISTVSRVLANAPSARVREETRARIHAVAKELGYRPNFAARALKSARTNVVAVVVPDLTNAVFAELMRGVEDEGHERGYLVLLVRAESLSNNPEALSRLIDEGRVDGALVQISEDFGFTELQPMWEGDLPVLVVNSVNAQRRGSVTLDDAAGAYLATSHLRELGHTRIGFIGGRSTSDTAQRRLEGYREALRKNDIEVNPEFITELGYLSESGGEALSQLCERGMPSALVVANVNAAHGVLLEARRRGVRVPEDLSIVAIHDAWTAGSTSPPLTTVRMPLYELGRTAMRAISERIEGGQYDDRVVVDPEPVLVVRESSGLFQE